MRRNTVPGTPSSLLPLGASSCSKKQGNNQNLGEQNVTVLTRAGGLCFDAIGIKPCPDIILLNYVFLQIYTQFADVGFLTFVSLTTLLLSVDTARLRRSREICFSVFYTGWSLQK